MKKSIAVCIIFAVTFFANGQSPSDRSEFLLHKSKKQRTAGFITLGGGTASVVSGIILVNQTSPGWETVDWGKALGGSALILTGVGLITTGIVLLVASDRNKQKASRLAIHLNKPVMINTGYQQTVLPYSMSVSFALR